VDCGRGESHALLPVVGQVDPVLNSKRSNRQDSNQTEDDCPSHPECVME